MKLPNRIRMLEEFDDEVPREVIFDLNPEKQEFFRVNWLRGDSPAEIKREWDRRAGASKTVAQVTGDQETDDPPKTAYDSHPELYKGSIPEF